MLNSLYEQYKDQAAFFLVYIREAHPVSAWQMAINENIQEILQLPYVKKQEGHTADGRKVECDVVGPIRIKWKNRLCVLTAMVLPGDSEPLLGAIPLEEMDLAVLPLEGKLVGKHHPDYPIFRI